MSSISSSTRTTLTARKATYEASLVIAQATYDDLLAKRAEDYRLDTGVAEQREKLRKLEALRKEIEWLILQIDKIDLRLAGKGVVNMNVRRR